MFPARKQSLLSNLQALSERMPSLLSIDHACAQKHILEAQRVVEVSPTSKRSFAFHVHFIVTIRLFGIVYNFHYSAMKFLYHT